LAELEGDVAAALFRTHDMESMYLAATQMYASGSLRGQVNCHLKRAHYYLEALEHGPTAWSFLSETMQSQDPWSHIERFLLGARFSALTRTKLPFAPRGRLTPQQAAHVRAAVLSSGRSSRTQVESFLTALATVARGPMRAETLREFSAVASRHLVRSPSAAHRLRRLVMLSPAAGEFPVHAYHLAAALRFFGDDQSARTLLIKGIKRAKRAFLREKLRRALAIVDGHPIPNLQAAFPVSMTFREVRATILTEEAERRFAMDDAAGATSLLRSIDPDIDALGTDTIWHVRNTELRGQIAEYTGATDAAVKWYQAALTCAQRGQNRAAQTRVQERLARVQQRSKKPAAPSIELQSPVISIHLQPTSNGIRRVTEWPNGKREKRKIARGYV